MAKKKVVKKVPDRVRVTRTQLALEKRDIGQFVLSHFQYDNAESIVFISDVFEAYQKWRKRCGLESTAVNIDGFGRLFPTWLNRKVFWHNGKTLNGIKGARLV